MQTRIVRLGNGLQRVRLDLLLRRKQTGRILTTQHRVAEYI